MDTEYRVIAELLALKDVPDDALLDRNRSPPLRYLHLVVIKR